MKLSYVACAAGIALSIVACSKSEVAPAPQAAPAQASAPVMAMPDAGKLTTVPTTATGLGATPAEAVDEAIKLAIKQVNGVAVDMSSEQFKSL